MYRLLIADDEYEIRKGLTEYFPWAEVGFRVEATAETGRQAADIVRSGRIDVVLTDIRMPVISGIELARIVFEEHLLVPVVFLSAYRDFVYAQSAIKYGVKRYVLKPTNHAEIKTTFLEIKRELDLLAAPEILDTDDKRRFDGKLGRSTTIVRLIKEYVAREYPRATLQGAAQIAHLNPQYVSRLFKREVGEQFNEYLMRVKMRQAAQLLTDIGYHTYEVSEMVGYSNPKNFTRRFKRYFGISPREYKQSPSITHP